MYQNTCVCSAKVVRVTPKPEREHTLGPFLKYLQRFLSGQKSKRRKKHENINANFRRPQRNHYFFYVPAGAEEEETIYIRNSMEGRDGMDLEREPTHRRVVGKSGM